MNTTLTSPVNTTNARQQPSNEQLQIENDGPRIRSSNYWDIPRDEYVLSIHENCLRLLMPDSIQASYFALEMLAATHVEVTRTPRSPCACSNLMLELLFEDGSPKPCTLHFGKDDLALGCKLPGQASVGKTLEFKMYTGPSDAPSAIVELPAFLHIEPEILTRVPLPRLARQGRPH